MHLLFFVSEPCFVSICLLRRWSLRLPAGVMLISCPKSDLAQKKSAILVKDDRHSFRTRRKTLPSSHGRQVETVSLTSLASTTSFVDSYRQRSFSRMTQPYFHVCVELMETTAGLGWRAS